MLKSEQLKCRNSPELPKRVAQDKDQVYYVPNDVTGKNLKVISVRKIIKIYFTKFNSRLAVRKNKVAKRGRRR